MMYSIKKNEENDELLIKSFIKVDKIDVPFEEVKGFIQRNKRDYIEKQIKIRIDSYFDHKGIGKIDYDKSMFSYNLGNPRKANNNGSYYIMLFIFKKDT